MNLISKIEMIYDTQDFDKSINSNHIHMQRIDKIYSFIVLVNVNELRMTMYQIKKKCPNENGSKKVRRGNSISMIH